MTWLAIIALCLVVGIGMGEIVRAIDRNTDELAKVRKELERKK